jgi:hypothetical protein
MQAIGLISLILKTGLCNTLGFEAEDGREDTGTGRSNQEGFRKRQAAVPCQT